MDATTCSLLPELLAAPLPPEWVPLRRAAEAALVGRELPTPRDEAWRYTDLASLRDLHPVPGRPGKADLDGHVLPEAPGTRLVFVNGHLAPQLSNVSTLPPGVRLASLPSASALAPELGSLAALDTGDVFTALNSARFHDGALIHVPRNVRVEAPLHVLFLSDPAGGQPTCSHPRLFVKLERGAELQLVEEYAGCGRYFTNAVVEVIVNEGAVLRHERVQGESREAIHVAALAVRVMRNARYSSRTLSFGAALSRQNPEAVLAEEGAEVELHGLALLDGTRHADTRSTLDHRVGGCTSRQVHKTIADEQGRAVFHGRILVRPGAQGTDAQQQSRTLLLSDEARVDAKPQLEIEADDVRCAHGAAIGQLDPDEVFYLQSRGLDLEAARNLLTYAFAAELLADIAVPSLRRRLRQAVMERTRHRAGRTA